MPKASDPSPPSGALMKTCCHLVSTPWGEPTSPSISDAISVRCATGYGRQFPAWSTVQTNHQITNLCAGSSETVFPTPGPLSVFVQFSFTHRGPLALTGLSPSSKLEPKYPYRIVLLNTTARSWIFALPVYFTSPCNPRPPTNVW